MGGLAGDTVGYLLRHSRQYLTSMSTTASSTETPSHLAWSLVGLSFLFQQKKEPKRTPRLCEGCLNHMKWSPQSSEMVWD